MARMAHLALGGTMVGALCIGSTAARAEENRFGVSAGLLMPLTLEVDGETPPTDPGPLVTFAFDQVVHPSFDAGLFLVGGAFSAGEPTHLITLFEFGAQGHFRQPLGEHTLLRVGLGVGYRRLFADLDRYDRVQGLAVDGDLQLSHPLGTSLIGQLKLGVLSQPVGGNGDFDVTWVAMPYVTLGFVFQPR